MTITPEADAVKPIPCSLPDPENAYTIAQVRENLIEMEAQLSSYPVNLSRGPGWVRQQILSMLDRGIVPDKYDENDDRPFEILRHSTDSNGRPVVDIFGTYFSNSDACKLRDELNRLLKG